VRAALWQHGTAAQRVLDAMTEDAWRQPINAFGCREIRHLVRLHLFDLSVHGWDVTDALGARPVWEPRLPFVVEFVVRAAPLTLKRLGVQPDAAVAVRVGDRSWTIDGRDGGWRLTDAAAPSGVTIGAEELVLLTTGRRALTDALEAASIEGDVSAAERVLAGWRVLADPPTRRSP
jgi:uncharacterized protein (TIGR03083 family)